MAHRRGRRGLHRSISCMGDLMSGRPLLHPAQPPCRDKSRVAKGCRGGATIATEDHEILDEVRDAVRLSQDPQACPAFQEFVRQVHKGCGAWP
jgi:hypothetical protein